MCCAALGMSTRVDWSEMNETAEHLTACSLTALFREFKMGFSVVKDLKKSCSGRSRTQSNQESILLVCNMVFIQSSPQVW